MVRKKDVRGEPSDESGAVVLFEKLRSEFKIVLDGYKGITRRLDQVEAKVDESRKELKQFMMDGFKELSGQQAETNKRLTELVERFSAHERAHAA